MKDHLDDRPAHGQAFGRGQSAPGVVSVHELYTLDEARRRLRWTESSMRSARRRGLKLLSCGKRKYLAGKEILRFLETLAAE